MAATRVPAHPAVPRGLALRHPVAAAALAGQEEVTRPRRGLPAPRAAATVPGSASPAPPPARGGAAAGSRVPLGEGRPAGAQTAAGSGRCQAGLSLAPPPRLKLPFQCGSGCVRCPAVCGGETPWGHRDSPTAPSLCHPAVPSLRAPNDAGALRAAQPVRGRVRCRPAPPVRFGSPARDTVVARCHRLQRDPTASGATS